jgi:hypothetical protein
MQGTPGNSWMVINWFIRRRSEPEGERVGLTTWQCLKESTRPAVTHGSDVASMAPCFNLISPLDLAIWGSPKVDACMCQLLVLPPGRTLLWKVSNIGTLWISFLQLMTSDYLCPAATHRPVSLYIESVVTSS